jgi:heat shock protein 5
MNKDNIPYVEVEFKGENKLYSPQEISAFILTKMKSIAEEYLGKPVKNVVITVPAYFNDAQRRATQAAGEIAGLNVVRILNEPTAASLAYGLNKKSSQNILVFDLGGGTFDVSCLSVDDGYFEVIATGGDTHLGGEDFDERIVDYLGNLYKKRTGKDPKKNYKAMSKLKKEAEKAKLSLSANLETTIEIDNFMDGDEFVEKLTRARFEELNNDLFKKCIDVVRSVIKDAAMTIDQIDEVVLVGGSTRIPKVQEMLREFFGGKQLCKDVNPDEAVAYGAAVQGAILSDDQDPGEVILLNVNPMTLGLETHGGIMTPLIPRNTRVPTKKVKIFTTAEDNQEQVRFRVFEGERAMVKDNHELGSFFLDGIKPAKRGVSQITATFIIDANGILTVEAEDKSTNNKKSITINAQEARLTEEQRDAAAAVAREKEDEDEKIKQSIISRERFRRYLDDISELIDKKDFNIDPKNKKEITDIIIDETLWLEKHTPLNTHKEDFIDKFHRIKDRIDGLLPRDTSLPETEDL